MDIFFKFHIFIRWVIIAHRKFGFILKFLCFTKFIYKNKTKTKCYNAFFCVYTRTHPTSKRRCFFFVSFYGSVTMHQRKSHSQQRSLIVSCIIMDSSVNTQWIQLWLYKVTFYFILCFFALELLQPNKLFENKILQQSHNNRSCYRYSCTHTLWSMNRKTDVTQIVYYLKVLFRTPYVGISISELSK